MDSLQALPLDALVDCLKRFWTYGLAATSPLPAAPPLQEKNSISTTPVASPRCILAAPTQAALHTPVPACRVYVHHAEPRSDQRAYAGMKEVISHTGLAHTGHRTCAHGNGLPILWEVRFRASIHCLHRHEVQGLQKFRHLLGARISALDRRHAQL